MRGTTVRLAVVFVLGMVVGVCINSGPRTLAFTTVSAQAPRDVPDVDRSDSDDNSFMGILERLWSVRRLIATLQSRLEAIDQVSFSPPDSESAAFLEVIASLVSGSAALQAKASAIADAHP